MKDAFAAEVARQGNDDALCAILRETCRITGMGFAAIARVTEERWVVAQSEDASKMGLNPGDELRSSRPSATISATAARRSSSTT